MGMIDRVLMASGDSVCPECNLPLDLPESPCGHCGHPLNNHLPAYDWPDVRRVFLECGECDAICPVPLEILHKRDRSIVESSTADIDGRGPENKGQLVLKVEYEPRTIESDFIAAHLRLGHGCKEIRISVPHIQRKDVPIAVLGRARARKTVIACDVLEWLDETWPRGMNPTKVPAKLMERVDLFRRLFVLDEETRSKKYSFYAFRSISKRISDALPILTARLGTDVQVIEGESLREATRLIMAGISDAEWQRDNCFIMAAHLLAEAGRKS